MIGQPIDEGTDGAIIRNQPEPDTSRAELVKKMQDEILAAKNHWKRPFERMRENMAFASGKQWQGQTDKDHRYVANIVQRVLKTTVSSLYAKSPTIVTSRRERMDFTLWDGYPESAAQAMQTVQLAQQALTTGVVPQPNELVVIQQAQALVEDIQQGIQHRQMMDKLGETLVLLLNYYTSEQTPGFKLQMKRMVRRARTTGVGYIELGYQREMKLSPAQDGKIADFAERLAVIGQLRADLVDGELDPYCGEAEEMRLAIEAIKAAPETVVREGLVFEFPASTRIIPSITTEKLMGWIGAEWVAKEILLTPERVKQVYGVDLGKKFTAYRHVAGSPQHAADRKTKDRENGLACIWEKYDKDTGIKYVIAEGYPDFLQEPTAPDISVDQYFPFYAITFNDVDDEAVLFPQSDVELMRHIQLEYNRKKEAERQHRIANRPLYVSPAGAFEEEEEQSLSNYAAHAVIKLNGLDKGRPVSDLLQPMQKIGVDPNLYETGSTFQDLQRVTGNQEATIGGTGNSTATESNIAEGSRQGALGLDGDDLDEMLSQMFRSAGQVLLMEMSVEQVKEICGPGAVWPEFSRTEIAKELYAAIKAGSSGRPNQARDAATFERIYPLLLQIPGISPRWLAERAIRIADDDVNIEDAVIEGLPAILAQNAMAQVSTGDPASDPNAQGKEGGDKNRAPSPGGTAQPEFPGAGAGSALQ